MDSLLKLLRENAALSTEDLAGMLSLSEDEIRAKIRQAQAKFFGGVASAFYGLKG